MRSASIKKMCNDKAIQVAMMGQIYQMADEVLIWLGEPTHLCPGELGFSLVHKLCDLTMGDSLYTPVYTDHWIAFAKVMKSPWFTRRWIIQELALAKKAFLHSGPHSLPWDDFADAVAFFIMKYEKIRSIFDYGRTFINSATMVIDFNSLYGVENLGPRILIETMENMFRKDNGQIIEYCMTLESLILALTSFEASDPRDIFYAVLSLAKSLPESSLDGWATEDKDLRPDYEKDLTEVCTDFVKYCVHTSESLDIICRHWAPDSNKVTGLNNDDRARGITANQKNWITRRPLASWMPPINHCSRSVSQHKPNSRTHGDSLVGSPGRKRYNASAGWPGMFGMSGMIRIFDMFRTTTESPELFNLRKRAKGADGFPYHLAPREIPDGTLRAEGFLVDTLHEVSQRCFLGIIGADALRIGRMSDDSTYVPDELWRTMVADRGVDGAYAPRWYRRASLRALKSLTHTGDLNTPHLIEQDQNSFLTDFLKRVRDVVWNRRFFRSYDEGRLGLAPPDAEVGDVVCIIYRCSVPVLLRPVEDDQHILIGECYFHGMMEGEAVTQRKQLRLRTEERKFVLR